MGCDAMLTGVPHVQRRSVRCRCPRGDMPFPFTGQTRWAIEGMIRRVRHVTVIACVALCCTAGFTNTARADVAKDAAIRGNEFFANSQYKEAAAAYQLARDGGYSTPEVLHNLGCAKMELGELDDAEQLFKQVDADPSAGKLAASSRFNLGAIGYRQAQAMIQKASQQPGGEPPPSPAGILDALKRSERGFRGAIELDPADRDAARNIEVVQRTIKQIKDQIEAERKKQEQQKNSDGKPDKNDQKQNPQDKNQNGQQGDKSKDQQSDKQDENADSKVDQQKQQQDKKDQPAQKQQSAQEQLTDAAKKQQELADQSKKTAQDRKDSQQGKPGAPTEQDIRDQENRQREQQRDLNKQTEDIGKQLNEQKKNAPPEEQKKLDEAAKKAEQAERAQQRAEQALKNHNPEKASQEQQKAAELLQQAAGNADDAQRPQQPEEQQANQQEAQESKEEQRPKSDMTAARILDKERREAAQKALRSLRLRGKAVPVDKDW